jgi:signal peptidase I
MKDTTTKPTKKESAKSFLKDLVKDIVVALVVVLIITTCVKPTIVSGQSMDDTLHDGNYLIVNKLAYKFGEPEHGDIIVFKYPRDTKVDYIKRVVGVPGDVLEMRNEKFYRNGQLVQEDYAHYTTPFSRYDNFGPYTVPADSYFVMGDNRDNSADSRDWGIVPVGYIHGKAWRLYWSWDSTTNTPRWGRIGSLVE